MKKSTQFSVSLLCSVWKPVGQSIALGLAVASSVWGAAAEVAYEVWDLPASRLVALDVPRDLSGTGPLKVTFDGERVRAQEVVGSPCCVVEIPDAWRAKSRDASIRVEMSREGEAEPALRRVSAVTVTNAAFRLTFDASKKGGLPSRLVWASGREAKGLGWGDRVHAEGVRCGRLETATDVAVWDGGEGPLFRQVRTSGVFASGGKPCEGKPRAIYNWLFFRDAPEWVMLVMSFASEGTMTWQQLQAGIAEFPFGTFSRVAVDQLKRGETRESVLTLPRDGTSRRTVGRTGLAFLAGSDFAAVFARDICCYTDPNRKVDYLHGTHNVSYHQAWNGEPQMRQTFYRFGAAADKSGKGILETRPPVVRVEGLRRLGGDEGLVAAWPGETVDKIGDGQIVVEVGVAPGRDAPGTLPSRLAAESGARARIRTVRVEGRLVATESPLFTVKLEDVETGRLVTLSSEDAWREIRTESAEGGVCWRFKGPLKVNGAPEFEVAVRAMPGRDAPGTAALDWSFAGETGTNAFALVEATVGEIAFVNAGRGMRALYPGCMGEVKGLPCTDAVQCRGNYPSMSCVMPWEAVWDEATGRGFSVAALDPKGGAKYVVMRGRSERGTVTLAVPHRLSWEKRNPGARSELSGVVAWRAFAGDWYEAALLYRDWAREHAVWYPKMGPEGRVSTPTWFKKDLGFIVRCWGWASNVVDEVKLCRDFLDLPVMAHWYVWHRQPFDNDYPNYFPAKPGFEEGVRQIHEMDCYAVPYTNGHLWDLHDRGAEDWDFTRTGAYGACRKRDGSVVTEKYRSVETNGQPVVFAAMCPASRTWHDKVGDNCVKVVNGADCDGFYMDQVGAFSTIDCRNPEHGHPFGGGSWWQEGFRKLLKDQRANCKKPVFFATEGNAEHSFDQIDAFVCWNIPGGVDTVPAFEMCYSGAVTVYCRSYGNPATQSREMRMKLANTLADGELTGWLPASYCQAKEVKAYLRECVRFRRNHAAWFYKGEMRRPPRLKDNVPEWSETWDIFGSKRPSTMPVVQTGARRLLDYDYDAQGNRLWRTGRVKGAFLYFTNFSPDETAVARVAIDWQDLGVDPTACTILRTDREGNRTPLTREQLESPMTFAPDTCFGIELLEGSMAAGSCR